MSLCAGVIMRKPELLLIEDSYGDAIGAVIVFIPRDYCPECLGSGQSHTCPECNGRGYDWDTTECSECDGTGEIDYLVDCDECNGYGYTFDEDAIMSLEDANVYMHKVELLRQRYGTYDLDELERRGIRDYFIPVMEESK